MGRVRGRQGPLIEDRCPIFRLTRHIDCETFWKCYIRHHRPEGPIITIATSDMQEASIPLHGQDFLIIDGKTLRGITIDGKTILCDTKAHDSPLGLLAAGLTREADLRPIH